MHKYDVIVLTDSRYTKDSKDPYHHNVFYEDALVVNALTAEGLIADRKAWNDPDMDWSTTKAVMFRSTWDYFDDFEAFSKWLNAVSKVTTLLNSEKIIRWNIDKHYLQDLQANGIHIAASLFIETGCTKTLKDLHTEMGWHETVLKPCISGAARHTYRLTADTCSAHDSIFKSLIANEAMILQPFQHRIVTEGERSLMVFNGHYTHAVLKRAKVGDYRVQDDFGGSVHQYTPTAAEIQFAIRTVNACDDLPLYARVDLFNDNSGNIALAELELIEPELWFRNHPEAATVLAKATKKKLSLELTLPKLKIRLSS